jgi:glutaredoxin
MILVELFSTEDCHLCEEARRVLLKVQQEIPFILEEKKIGPADTSFQEYREKVPVVIVDHQEVFHYTVNEAALRRILHRRQE